MDELEQRRQLVEDHLREFYETKFLNWEVDFAKIPGLVQMCIDLYYLWYRTPEEERKLVEEVGLELIREAMEE
jgi:hypothetical protein